MVEEHDLDDRVFGKSVFILGKDHVYLS